MVHLRKADERNVWELIGLDVYEEQQGYVSSNITSIVDAYLALSEGKHAYPFGIYDDDTPVGFIMVQYDLSDEPEIEKDCYTIRRIMIDKRYQHRGYGRKALQLALDFIRTEPCGKANYCFLSFKPWNENAHRLYNEMGFVDTEFYDGDELIAVKRFD